MTNLQQAASDALQVQNACNLSGVARSFLEAVKAVNDEANRLNEGTEWRNNHPIIRLFVDKLASICGMQGDSAFLHYGEADQACRDLLTSELPTAGNTAHCGNYEE
jgi:hypothetical protein